MIDFEHVTKIYKRSDKPALEDIDFHVDDGEFVFLVGHSGAGKSTLLKAIQNGVYDHINVRSMRYTVTGGDASTYYVNDAQSSVTGTGGLYVIDGDGAVVPNNAGAKDTYVITSGGVQSLERKSANTSNTFTFSGSGWGHNVGMSQWGAFAMAEKGYTYRDILNFYYTGITLS